MRKIIFIFVSLILLSGNNLIAQWSPVKRLTYGYKDSNPSFNSIQYFGGYKWEFLVFQRQIDSASRICVLRLNNNGLLDSVKYLTSDSYINRNPCIAYRPTSGDSISNALALWETNRNGHWDIYASYYNSGSWSAPFPFDSSSSNKSYPKGILITSTDFAITYSKDGEVIYRKYNAATKTVVIETNLTTAISISCDKPVIGEISNSILINFRGQKNDSTHSIYSVTSTNYGESWVNNDTISNMGDNSTLFILRNFGSPQQVFESKRNGKTGIYSYIRTGSNSTTTDSVLTSPYFNYYGMKSWMYPFVFDNYISHINAVVRKSSNETKILFDAANPYYKDSITIGDTSKSPTLALNNGVRSGFDFLFFAVFTNDTASITSLYYKTKIFVTGNITRTGNYIADKYSLYQNYPNPFNPTTKIKFDIPKLSDIKLIIFDAVGREVKNITQNNLATGSYEYEFNGESLSSGIYYFRLETHEFVKTVKMALVK